MADTADHTLVVLNVPNGSYEILHPQRCVNNGCDITVATRERAHETTDPALVPILAALGLTKLPDRGTYILRVRETQKTLEATPV